MGFDPRHTITVNGTGVVKAVPDVARLHVAAERTSPAVGEALAVAAQDVERATALARDLGLGDRDIASGALSLHPVYGDRGDNDIRGYSVTQSLTFTVRELPVVGRLLTRLGEELGPALRVNHLGLEVSEPAPLRAQARALAMTAAREQAEELAAQAGRSLGEVLVIDTEADGSAQAGPMTRSFAASLAPEAGEQDVTASVKAVFALV